MKGQVSGTIWGSSGQSQRSRLRLKSNLRSRLRTRPGDNFLVILKQSPRRLRSRLQNNFARSGSVASGLGPYTHTLGPSGPGSALIRSENKGKCACDHNDMKKTWYGCDAVWWQPPAVMS